METVEKVLDGKYELATQKIEDNTFDVLIKWRRVFDDDGESLRPTKIFFGDGELKEVANLLKKHGF